ncbi:MAG TPA: hypothetical protein ENN07_05765, partial [candidate division Zixibacteria bacterium]|nr:hypothetical protein [candidate division Zixibacteria bacterium]
MKQRILFVIAIMAFAGIALAVPTRMFFQGKFTDDFGMPMDGEFPVTFSIWNSPIAGTMLWSESRTVLFFAGLFAEQLGQTVPLPQEIFTGEMLYIEMEVDGASMGPRKPLITVPYAFRSSIADSVVGGSVNYDTLINFIETYLDSAGTHISHIDSVSYIDSVAFIDSITFISHITRIDSIRSVDSITYISHITHIDSVSFIDSISYVSHISFIDSIGYIDFISFIDSIGYIDSIGWVGRTVWADSAHWAGYVHWDSIDGVPDDIGGGSSNWERVGDNLHPIPPGNVGIGVTSPTNRLHVDAEGLTTAIYGAHDRTNWGYIGGSDRGLHGEGNPYGIFAKATEPDSWAGYFDGNVNITGDLTVEGSFGSNLWVEHDDYIESPLTGVRINKLSHPTRPAKIDANFIDPVIQIQGEQYATWMAEAIGIRVDVVGEGKLENGHW